MIETEIKLLLPEASRAAVESHPLFGGVSVRRVHQVSTYYDTPDLMLRARGLTLRVRRTGTGFVQTVKSTTVTAGFASRGEWEWPVPSEAIDVDAVARDPEACGLLGGDLGRVVPVFATDVEREIRVLSLDGGTVVEAAVDVGEVRAGDRSASLSEVELELKAGPVGPMLRVAVELVRAGSLRFGPDSKSDRGYALLGENLSRLPGSSAVDLPDGIVLRDAFPVLLATATRAFAADLSPAARGEAEGVHRLRAAIRRLRTLLVLFAPHLDPNAATRLDAELRDFGRVLGGGRDWDVFLAETLASAEEDLGADAAGLLRDAAEARRGQAHAAVAAAVEGPAPTELLLDLSLWTSDAGWMRRPSEGDARLRDMLPGLLDRLRRRALKRGRRLKSLDAEDLHTLRKSLKRLRHACEDAASLFRRDEVRRYVTAVKRLLGDLGHINDAAVTLERLADLSPAVRPELVEPAAALLAWNAKRRRASERELRRRWRKFRQADPFWG